MAQLEQLYQNYQINGTINQNINSIILQETDINLFLQQGGVQNINLQSPNIQQIQEAMMRQNFLTEKLLYNPQDLFDCIKLDQPLDESIFSVKILEIMDTNPLAKI